MKEIKTNERFDRLTNLDISTHYRNIEIYLFLNSFTSALSYWVTKQNPNNTIIDLVPIIEAYTAYIASNFDEEMPTKFTYEQVKTLVNDDIFEKIPEILALNEMKPDFIDLGALSRNVFYMILREEITQMVE